LRHPGVDRLHVVDASILPEIPSVPTNVTTIMVAERAQIVLSWRRQLSMMIWASRKV